MGSGKSYWGRQWASAHGLHFIDLDQEIEKSTGLTITGIFEQKGEAWFREQEAATLQAVITKENCLVACGGGTPCFADNMKWMNANGITVYLQASAPFILDRIRHETQQRPLLKKLNPAELLFFIEQKLKERSPFYGQAQYLLKADALTADSLTAILNNVNT